MWSAAIANAETAVTSSEAAGGCGWDGRFSASIYDELPDTLPAVCIGGRAAGDFVHARGRTSGAGGEVTANAELDIVLACDLTTAPGNTYSGPAGADTAAERLIGALARQGFAFVRAQGFESAWAGRDVHMMILTVAQRARLSYNPPAA
jgi:hypothetical protein